MIGHIVRHFLGRFFKTGCDDGYTHLGTHRRIDDGAKNNIGIFVAFFLDQLGRFVHFIEGEITSSSHIKENAGRSTPCQMISMGREPPGGPKRT